MRSPSAGECRYQMPPAQGKNVFRTSGLFRRIMDRVEAAQCGGLNKMVNEIRENGVRKQQPVWVPDAPSIAKVGALAFFLRAVACRLDQRNEGGARLPGSPPIYRHQQYQGRHSATCRGSFLGTLLRAGRRRFIAARRLLKRIGDGVQHELKTALKAIQSPGRIPTTRAQTR